MLIFLLVLGVILIAADQLIKWWIVENLMPVKVMDFIRFGDFEVLGLRYCENTGAAFSSFSGARWFLVILVTVMLIVLLVFSIRYTHKRPLFLISSVMIMSGGVGNLIDRIRLGYVIDYLDVKLFNFAVFNFADICVVVGATLLLIFLFFIEPKVVAEENSEKEQVNEQT